jgi:hypothetical protein
MVSVILLVYYLEVSDCIEVVRGLAILIIPSLHCLLICLLVILSRLSLFNNVLFSVLHIIIITPGILERGHIYCSLFLLRRPQIYRRKQTFAFRVFI